MRYILVYTTDPMPDQTAFTALRDSDAPRYDEDAGVHTKEMVGPRSPLQVHGDIRLFTDSRLDPGGVMPIRLAAGEGGLASVREGAVSIEGDSEGLGPGTTLVIPPADEPRTMQLRASQPSRVIRVVHGPGHGFLQERPYPRHGAQSSASS